MKFELNRPTDYSNEAIINEIIRVSKLVDKPLSRTKFDQNSKYRAATIEKRFGSWLHALEKAGLDESYWYIKNKEISKKEITDELIKVSEILGRKSFSQKEFITHSRFVDKGIFSRKFGSFSKLMNESGFIVPLKSRKYTDEERYENLLNVWIFYGRQPNYSEMKKAPSVVGPKAYVTRWESWKKALIAFIAKVNNDVSMSEIENNQIDEAKNQSSLKVKKTKSIADSREIPIGLRFDIFKRDKFRCVICGRSPATHFEIKELQADHIFPFSKGGKTIKENLQTLCNECNNGKSNKIEE